MGRLWEGPSSAFQKINLSVGCWIWNFLRGMKKYSETLWLQATISRLQLSLSLSCLFIFYYFNSFLELEECFISAQVLNKSQPSTYPNTVLFPLHSSSPFVELFIWKLLVLSLTFKDSNTCTSAVAQLKSYCTKLWAWEDECFKVH